MRIKPDGVGTIIHLLTWHGTVVCRERTRGTLIHRPLTGPFDDADILSLGEAAQALQADLGTLLRDDADALQLELPNGPMAGWTFTRSPDHRSVVVTHDTKRLIADSSCETMELVEGETGPTTWFLALTQADLSALRDIVASNWLVKSEDPRQPAKGVMGPDFALQVGSLLIDLRWNLPFDLADFPFRLTILRDGWRIDQIYRFRPLIYYAAFDSPHIMQQFSLSLRSLVAVGDYDGDVAVLTDKTAEDISAHQPPDMPGSLVALQCDACDRTGYLAARVAITEWQDAWAFQPLLYVDTDIVFDRPVAPMLHAIAQSDRIAAPLERGEHLATSVFVGCSLLREDNCDPGSEVGFNAGTLGIPNLRRHAGTLALIGRIMGNRTSIFGRQALPYADQAIANYVSFRLAKIDTEVISPYVRLAGSNADPSGKRGLVHFCWALGADRRVELMQSYLRSLGVTEPDDGAAALTESAT